MKIYLKSILILLVLGLSGCTCEESIIDSYLLSDYEKSLIPFNDYQDLFYLNENGQQIIDH